jgi:hypothetical protein
MAWTETNLVIQIIAGILGAHAAATAVKDHHFGFWGHSLAGMIAGALSGYFLQGIVSTVVRGDGVVAQPGAVDNFVLQGLAGAVVGAIAMLLIGMIKQMRPEKNP